MSINLKVRISIRTRKGRFPAGGLRRAMEVAREGLTADVRRAFDTATDPATGRPWPPRLDYYPWPSLVKSGAMRTAYLTAASSAEVRGATIILTIPADPAYSKFHWTGTGRMAARKGAGVSAATKRRVRGVLAQAGRKGLRVF